MTADRSGQAGQGPIDLNLGGLFRDRVTDSAELVATGRRATATAEELVAEGKELQVAFAAVGDSNQVAVDWPATSGGRFS